MQQVPDFWWDALDSMSGGMECHCSCEEQFLAIGTGKVGVSTLAIDAY